MALGRGGLGKPRLRSDGYNIAGLYSLVATCAANGKNPLDYLTDVLGRIRSHPSDQLDELLPQNWKPPETPAAVASGG